MFKNISFTLLRQIFSATFSLGTVILLARFLEADGMGKFSLSVLIPQFMISILNLGLPSSLVFFVASRKYAIGFAIREVNKFLIYFIPGVVLLFGVVFISFSSSWFPELNTSLIMLSIAAIPFMLTQTIQVTFLQALEEFRSYNVMVLMQPIILLLSTSVLIATSTLNPQWAVASFLFSQIVVWYLTRHKINRLIPNPDDEDTSQNPTSSKEFLKTNLQYGLKAYFSNITAMVNYRADLYLVGLLLSASSAGIYAIALQISDKLFIVSQAISTVILPRLSSLINNEVQQSTITNVAARISFILTVLAGILLYFMTDFFLIPLFGEEYREVFKPLLILIFAASLSGYFRILANSMAAKNKPEVNLYTGIVTSVLNVGLNLYLIPKYGLTGAAYATLFSFCGNLVITTFCYSRIFKLSGVNLIDLSFELSLLKKTFDKRKQSSLKSLSK